MIISRPQSNILVIVLVFTLLAKPINGVSECDCENGNFEDKLSKIVSVDKETHQFVDEFGRTRWFHGSNVVSKSDPYHPDIGGPEICNASLPVPFCDADIDYLQELGVNVIRLGVMWGGAEPDRGTYNCEYFCVIHEIIQKLSSKGIYTLVDVHQDVLARQMCGEGVPDWFMKKDWIANEALRFPFPYQLNPFTTDENGIPEPWDQCWTIKDWFLSYFTVAAGDAFDKLYNNYDGLLDSFANYWGKIASEYRNYSSVLGYDLLNEPWAGNIWKDPTVLIPGVADKKHLESVWQNCSVKIREVDPETIVFFEGVTWDILDGHSTVPGNVGSKAAMSYHYYSPPQLGLRTMYVNRLKDEERLETGGILTEFRMWAAEGEEDSHTIIKQIRDTIDMAEIYLQSWIGWGYRSVLSRDPDVAKEYARTYAQAVAGFVTRMYFNIFNSDYSISWRINKSITAPTEFKINKRIYYPNGFAVYITPENSATWEVIDDQNIHLKYTQNAINGEEITVKIRKILESRPQSTTDKSNAFTITFSLVTVFLFVIITYFL